MTGIRTLAVHAVQEWTTALEERAPDLSRGEAEALHDVRVAVRRLRSILRAAGPAFAGDDAAALEARLQELGRGLGTARDREVLAAGLRRHAATSLSGALERSSDDAARRLRDARAAAVDALAAPEFLQLVEDLRSFADDPPAAGGKVTAHHILGRDLRRVRRRSKEADAEGLAVAERETLLHGVRKAAKRLRYDLTAFPAGSDADAVRDAAERIQDALGDRRDALALAEVLRIEEWRGTGRRAEELGRMRRAEEQRAETALAAYRDALPALKRASSGP